MNRTNWRRPISTRQQNTITCACPLISLCHEVPTLQGGLPYFFWRHEESVKDESNQLAETNQHTTAKYQYMLVHYFANLTNTCHGQS
jgi:hypothetical protein